MIEKTNLDGVPFFEHTYRPAFYDQREALLTEKAGEIGRRFDEVLAEKVKEKREEVSDKKLLNACYDMESLFIGLMLKTMRNSIPENDLFGKSIARDIFTDMLYDEYAQIVAKTDQFGIAKTIYKQLTERRT